MGDNEEFRVSMNNAADLIISKVFFNTQKACLLVERDAKKNCPVDEGRLRASITHQTNITSGEIVGLIGTNLDYAPYVHYGTGIYAKNGNGRKTPWVWIGTSTKYRGGHKTEGQKPQPFLEDALKNNKSKIAKILAKD